MSARPAIALALAGALSLVASPALADNPEQSEETQSASETSSEKINISALFDIAGRQRTNDAAVFCFQQVANSASPERHAVFETAVESSRPVFLTTEELGKWNSCVLLASLMMPD